MQVLQLNDQVIISVSLPGIAENRISVFLFFQAIFDVGPCVIKNPDQSPLGDFSCNVNRLVELGRKNFN